MIHWLMKKELWLGLAAAVICLAMLTSGCGGGFSNDSDNARTLSGPLFGDTTGAWRQKQMSAD
jgi:hypothetical protein